MFSAVGGKGNVDWFGLYCRFLNPKQGSLIAEPTNFNSLRNSHRQADKVCMAQGRKCLCVERNHRLELRCFDPNVVNHYTP